MFDLDGLEQAQEVVAQAMPSTPQYRWPGLCDRIGCDVWVKHENHTPIGAFKVRGGLVLLDELKRAGRLPGKIITATRGNHGQSIPFAACRLGVPVTVLAPAGNSVEKNTAMAGWGAELIEFGHDFEAARAEAVRRADAEGAFPVPPFHRALVRGVATYALELFTAVTDLDVVYVPIGMGSGICGLIRTRDLLGLRTRDRRRRGGAGAGDGAELCGRQGRRDRIRRHVRRRHGVPVADGRAASDRMPWRGQRRSSQRGSYR